MFSAGLCILLSVSTEFELRTRRETRCTRDGLFRACCDHIQSFFPIFSHNVHPSQRKTKVARCRVGRRKKRRVGRRGRCCLGRRKKWGNLLHNFDHVGGAPSSMSASDENKLRLEQLAAMNKRGRAPVAPTSSLFTSPPNKRWKKG